MAGHPSTMKKKKTLSVSGLSVFPMGFPNLAKSQQKARPRKNRKKEAQIQEHATNTKAENITSPTDLQHKHK